MIDIIGFVACTAIILGSCICLVIGVTIKEKIRAETWRQIAAKLGDKVTAKDLNKQAKELEDLVKKEVSEQLPDEIKKELFKMMK